VKDGDSSSNDFEVKDLDNTKEKIERRIIVESKGKEYTEPTFLDQITRIFKKSDALPTLSQLSKRNSKSGRLFQRNVSGNYWNEKRFILQSTNLYYFNQRKKNDVDGVIKLEGATITSVVDPENVIHQYQIIISHPMYREIYLAVKTEEDMNDWLNAFERVYDE